MAEESDWSEEHWIRVMGALGLPNVPRYRDLIETIHGFVEAENQSEAARAANNLFYLAKSEEDYLRGLNTHFDPGMSREDMIEFTLNSIEAVIRILDERGDPANRADLDDIEGDSLFDPDNGGLDMSGLSDDNSDAESDIPPDPNRVSDPTPSPQAGMGTMDRMARQQAEMDHNPDNGRSATRDPFPGNATPGPRAAPGAPFPDGDTDDGRSVDSTEEALDEFLSGEADPFPGNAAPGPRGAPGAPFPDGDSVTPSAANMGTLDRMARQQAEMGRQAAPDYSAGLPDVVWKNTAFLTAAKGLAAAKAAGNDAEMRKLWANAHQLAKGLLKRANLPDDVTDKDVLRDIWKRLLSPRKPPAGEEHPGVKPQPRRSDDDPTAGASAIAAVDIAAEMEAIVLLLRQKKGEDARTKANALAEKLKKTGGKYATIKPLDILTNALKTVRAQPTPEGGEPTDDDGLGQALVGKTDWKVFCTVYGIDAKHIEQIKKVALPIAKGNEKGAQPLAKALFGGLTQNGGSKGKIKNDRYFVAAITDAMTLRRDGKKLSRAILAIDPSEPARQ